MAIPTSITGLVQTQNGYNLNPEGHIRFDTFEPYLELRDVDVPELDENHVMIEMTMASINPSDLHFLKGEYGQPRVAGKPAGFEGVGSVIASGSDPYATCLLYTSDAADE